VNAWLPPDDLSTGHTRLDVASHYDVGSWLASIPGVQIEGTPSAHYDHCTDGERLVCGAIADARQHAGEAAFGAPLTLPHYREVRPGAAVVWQQDFFKKRVTVEGGAVKVVDRAAAQCEDKASGSFCGSDFGDDSPRSLYTCKDHAVESRIECDGRCGLALDSGGGLSLGCQPGPAVGKP
jgi:hypothetical protein